MRDGLGLLSSALLGSALLVAASIGVTELDEGYLRSGLWSLTARRGVAALGSAIPFALVGAAAAWILRRVTERGRLALVAIPLALVGALVADERLLPGLAPSWRLGGFGVAAVLWWAVRARRGGAPDGAASGTLAALAIACTLATAAWPTRIRTSDHPNILLVVLDTVRADRLSTFGYTRPTSPRLERLARDAVRFTDFHSTSSWTLPSHASLFTGLYPAQHLATQEHPFLARRHTTIAERLANAGYTTYAAIANPWAGPLVQLDQGFLRVDDLWRDGHGWVARRPGKLHPVTRAVLAFLDAQPHDRPFFAFLNYVDAHGPYTPAEPFRSRFLRQPLAVSRERDLLERATWADHYTRKRLTPDELAVLSDLYDGEVAQLDDEIGSLLDRLREAGRYDDTFIVVTSDHGEHFGENDRVFHSFTLYRTAVRVPLIIRPPGGVPGGRTDGRPGQLVDLVPTLLHAAGLREDALPHQGFDLLDEATARTHVLAEYYRPHQEFSVLEPPARRASAALLAPLDRRLRSLETDGLRLIWSSDGRHELYDLRTDPAEERNLFERDDHREHADRLQAVLEDRLASLGAGASSPTPAATVTAPDRETRDALRALGYAR